MVKIIEGDLLDSNADYIIHQVNCMGKMSSGVAKAIRNRHPVVYKEYISLCKLAKRTGLDLLGETQFVRPIKDTSFVNMFSQRNYGYDGGLYTNYGAFRICLKKIANAIEKEAIVAMPYLIGCDRGGGDWDTVLSIIEEEFAEYNVELWRLKEH